MNIVNIDKRISTAKSIAQLGLPASQKRKAIESLALVEALISPFFSEPEIKTAAKKAPAIKPVLKVR